MSIAVVGGGAAGLVATYRLAAAGAPVTVFERAAQVGGRARSDQLDGCIVDAGAQLFGSGFSTLFRVANEIGAGSLLIRSPGRDALFRNGRINPITYGSVASMVTSSALPTTLKLKLGARYVPLLLRHARHLDASDPLSAGGDLLDTESVREWGERELGRDFIELLAYPLLGAYYGSAPEQMSVAVYHALAKAGLDVSVHAVRGGTGALMSALADAARAKGAEIRVGTEVRKVASEGGRVVIDDEQFDAVVLALPAPQLSEIIELPHEIALWLANVQFAPSAVLAVLLNRPVPGDYFGLSLLRGDGRTNDVVAICVQGRKAPGLVPPGRGLLICLGSPQSNAALIAGGESAVDRMLDVAEHVYPGLRERVTRAKLYRHAYGYPVFYPGYLKHLRKFPGSALPAGVHLAGDYMVAPTVEGALRSGERAAADVLSYVRAG